MSTFNETLAAAASAHLSAQEVQVTPEATWDELIALYYRTLAGEAEIELADTASWDEVVAAGSRGILALLASDAAPATATLNELLAFAAVAIIDGNDGDATAAATIEEMLATAAGFIVANGGLLVPAP